jgi:4-deoxy-L-threo-5-hexosulose-uronate ketol-isomerase
MQVRFLPDNKTYQRMSTRELREAFLVDNIFNNDKVDLVYTDVDRAIIGSAVPVGKTLRLEASKKELAAGYFTERREIGVINIGGKGFIQADERTFELDYKDALYIGKETKSVEFKSQAFDKPAKFYMVSYPAHTKYDNMLMKFSEAEPASLGTQEECNKRVIYKYIHRNGIKSCQLVMGLTELEEGSIWNTMPAHTHLRRSEIYTYFNVKRESVVFHFMGEEKETRNLVIKNLQAVISPSWSIHAGAGTKNYSFIWAMGGENQEFTDMDMIKIEDLL